MQKKIELLNELLIFSEQNFRRQFDEPKIPIIFIIGAPRSGTTLVSQLLAHRGGFGYIDNFLARFWKAPSIALLMKQIFFKNQEYSSLYKNEFGRTEGIYEPHEFGYFWDQWFNQGQETHQLQQHELENIDGDSLKKSIAALEYVANKPMIFKNNTWHTLNVLFLAELFPTAKFVVCRRNLLYNAQSLSLGRLKYHNNFETWWSIKPANYAEIIHHPWWEQVILQVKSINQEMDSQLKEVMKERAIEVMYENLCSDPNHYIDKIVNMINTKTDYYVSESGNVPASFKCTNEQKLNDEHFSKLSDFYHKLVLRPINS